MLPRRMLKWSRREITSCVRVTADTSHDTSSSMHAAVTSLDDDVKRHVVGAQLLPACARETRQSVITDAREALAATSALRTCASRHVLLT